MEIFTRFDHFYSPIENVHKLPFDWNRDDVDILNAVNRANGKLGELNGVMNTLPNPKEILNAILLGEAKESSAIENIVTTFDEVFKELALNDQDSASKEVVHYRQAALYGFEEVRKNGFISPNMIEAIHRIIDPAVGGIRRIPGTVILNTKTKGILHTPPQSEEEIREYLKNLTEYINYDELEDIDPLIKMAILHYQFESIHPFCDGNGRTGRILNVLYLVLKGRLSLPVLYLSKYINRTRGRYYQRLDALQNDLNRLKDYVIYMVDGVYETCVFTLDFIDMFRKCMDACRSTVKSRLPKIYSEELITYLFYDFYTKNDYLREKLSISRNTAGKYLKELEEIGVLTSEKVGKEKLYKNNYLFELIQKW